MSDQQVIVAIFDNEAAADAAVAALNTWDEETVDMDLDAIGSSSPVTTGRSRSTSSAGEARGRARASGSSSPSSRPRRCWPVSSRAASPGTSITRAWA